MYKFTYYFVSSHFHECFFLICNYWRYYIPYQFQRMNLYQSLLKYYRFHDYYLFHYLHLYRCLVLFLILTISVQYLYLQRVAYRFLYVLPWHDHMFSKSETSFSDKSNSTLTVTTCFLRSVFHLKSIVV